MNKLRAFILSNYLYIIFSFFLTLSLVCSYIFGHQRGIQTCKTFFVILLTTILSTPITTGITIKISQLSIETPETSCSIINTLYRHGSFYAIAIFLMQIPTFLAFYPGLYYYDATTQITQYESATFTTHHPLIHTLYMGFFKNLLSTPNEGYAIATIIQMIIVSISMGYALRCLYKYTHNILLCTISMFFYGFFPVNSLLTISSTKDILFASFMLIFFIHTIELFYSTPPRIFAVYFILNTTLMLLFRNNAIYAFILLIITIIIYKFVTRKNMKTIIVCLLCSFLLFICANRGLISVTSASNGSIKETMSIPCQNLARIYLSTEDYADKELIKLYISEPENYNYFLSDPIKQQLPFNSYDDTCKNFIVDSFSLTQKYPLVSINSLLYNTQGYWDIFHSPYSSEHYFLTTKDYRGDAVFDSKLPNLAKLYIEHFHVTKEYPHILTIFLNSAIYIWITIFCFANSIHSRNYALTISLVFPLFYLLTLCLGPAAIIRYTYPFFLLTPILIGISLFSLPSIAPKNLS